MKLKVTFKALLDEAASDRNAGANVVAYAFVISDRRLKFQSDGKKMNVIY